MDANMTLHDKIYPIIVSILPDNWESAYLIAYITEGNVNNGIYCYVKTADREDNISIFFSRNPASTEEDVNAALSLIMEALLEEDTKPRVYRINVTPSSVDISCDYNNEITVI